MIVVASCYDSYPVLLRPGLQYDLSKVQQVAIWYAYLYNWESDGTQQVNIGKHRVWEQYTIKPVLRETTIENRFRLEQRFLESGEKRTTAHRFRYYLQAKIPLHPPAGFARGIFFCSTRSSSTLQKGNT